MEENKIATHYSQIDIVDRILSGLESSGISVSNVSVNDLGPVDEFHTGGRAATEHLLKNLHFDAGNYVLDIGCGIGGTSRFLADRYKVNVYGVDLTSKYVETGNILNQWVSLENKIDLECCDASSIQKDNDVFDGAVMLHVGMNIENKAALFMETARLLKRGGVFAIYDVMLKQASSIQYPMPWATNSSMSFLEPVEHYIQNLEKAGFCIENKTGRGEFAKTFFAKMREAEKVSDAPPDVGLHLLVGPSIREKMQNFSQAIFDNIVEPTEIIARKL